jgi:hypothetical protein
MIPLIIVASAAVLFGIGATLALLLALCHLSKLPVLGHAEPIDNTNRRFGSASVYYRVPIVAYGVKRYLLLTPKELAVCTGRADGNPEDCPDLTKNPLCPILRVSV